MTHWAETGCQKSVERVVANLDKLSCAGDASPEFRTVIARICQRWARLRLALDPQASGGAPPLLH